LNIFGIYGENGGLISVRFFVFVILLCRWVQGTGKKIQVPKNKIQRKTKTRNKAEGRKIQETKNKKQKTRNKEQGTRP